MPAAGYSRIIGNASDKNSSGMVDGKPGSRNRPVNETSWRQASAPRGGGGSAAPSGRGTSTRQQQQPAYTSAAPQPVRVGRGTAAAGSLSARGNTYEPSTKSKLRSSMHASLEDDDDVGYSELQAAFERAYDKMLQEPPPSVVDSVLSMQWGGAKKGSKQRKSPVKATSKGWNSSWAKGDNYKTYDSLVDPHCRRVVENPRFKDQLKQTRPDAQYLLSARITNEDRAAASKFGRGPSGPLLPWQQVVMVVFQRVREKNGGAENDEQNTGDEVGAEQDQQPVGSTDIAGAGAVAEHNEAPAGDDTVQDEGGIEEEGSAPEARESNNSELEAGQINHADVASQEIDGGNDSHSVQQSADTDSENKESESEAQPAADPEQSVQPEAAPASGGLDESKVFSALNQVLQDGPHLPDAFAHLTSRLEQLWEDVFVPEDDRAAARAMYFSPITATNLSHLFYQVSRWTQYQAQVHAAIGLIVRREGLLKDVHDHLSLNGGEVDESVEAKMEELYTVSLQCVNCIHALRSLYAGKDSQMALLQDYVDKIMQDTAELRTRQESGGSTARSAPSSSQESQRKVQLAAEFVVESVSREANVVEQAIMQEVHAPKQNRADDLS